MVSNRIIRSRLKTFAYQGRPYVTDIPRGKPRDGNAISFGILYERFDRYRDNYGDDAEIGVVWSPVRDVQPRPKGNLGDLDEVFISYYISGVPREKFGKPGELFRDPNPDQRLLQEVSRKLGLPRKPKMAGNKRITQRILEQINSMLPAIDKAGYLLSWGSDYGQEQIYDMLDALDRTKI